MTIRDEKTKRFPSLRTPKIPDAKHGMDFIPSASAIPPALQDDTLAATASRLHGSQTVKAHVPNLTRHPDPDMPPKVAKDDLCRRSRLELRKAFSDMIRLYDSSHSMSIYNNNLYSRNQVAEYKNLFLFRIAEAMDLATASKLSFPEFLYLLNQEATQHLINELQDSQHIIDTLRVSEELADKTK